jgi:hypothetical protein
VFFGNLGKTPPYEFRAIIEEVEPFARPKQGTQGLLSKRRGMVKRTVAVKTQASSSHLSLSTRLTMLQQCTCLFQSTTDGECLQCSLELGDLPTCYGNQITLPGRAFMQRLGGIEVSIKVVKVPVLIIIRRIHG